MRNSIRGRLTMAFIVLATSPLLLVGIVLAWQSFNLQSQQALTLQHEVAQRVATQVTAFFERVESELRVVSQVQGLQELDRERQQAILSELLSYEDFFEELTLLDSQGQEQIHVSRLRLTYTELGDRAKTDEFVIPKTSGEVYYSPVRFKEDTGEPFMTISLPLQDVRTGLVDAVLVSEVRVKRVWDLIAGIQLSQGQSVYIVDAEGTVVAHRNPSVVLGDTHFAVPDQDGAQRGLTNESVLLAVDTVRFGEQEFNVIAEQAVSEALAPAVNSIVAIMITIVVAIGAAIGLGFLVVRQIVQPIQAMAATAQVISSGDLSQQVRVTSHDEVGALARAFNDMTARLRELIAGLENRTRELEASQRVTFAASERVTPDELLDLVVNLIRDQFDLYHAQVYIIDEEQNAAVLRQSTGYAGRQLLQRGHKIPLDATALVTKAIETGESVLVDDTTQSPDFMSNPLLPETKSELTVPLKLKDQIIGVLDAQDRTPGRFGESTVRLFRSMANQIATLFENSELLERVTAQTESLTIFTNQLRTAAEIAQRMGTLLDPEQLLSQTVELLQSRFGLYHAHIYILDGTNRQLIVRSGSGEVGRVLRKQGHSISLDAEKSLVARAARSEEVVLVEDTSLESDFLPNPLLPQTRSELAIPLISGDKVLGVLDIQDNQPNCFTETDIDTFRTLAGQIATTLQTAGIFEETQVRLKVSQALANTQTENDVLDVLVQQAGMYPQTQVMVFLNEWDKEDRSLYLRRAESFESRLASTPPPGLRLPASQVQMISERSRTDGIFVSPNLLEDENADPTVREMARQTGAKSMLTVPIVERDELVGIISISSEEEGYFDEQKIRLYRAVAEQGATALRIARLNDENLRTAERLREVDRLKSEFLASMSHELRTPLNSIIGYTEIMLMGLDSELDPEMAEDVQAIYDNGQHLLRIINDVLDLAKIEAGRLELNKEEVPVEILVDAASSSVTGLLVNKEKPVEFKVEVEKDLPTIYGDQVRLNQVINNLASNAVKFTEEGQITLRAFKDDGWICLEVEDTGIGIAEEDQNKIFERFQQVDGSNARKQEGTGLGLAITRHLVEMHGGTIKVKSTLGEGSTFTVRLPVEHQEI